MRLLLTILLLGGLTVYGQNGFSDSVEWYIQNQNINITKRPLGESYFQTRDSANSDIVIVEGFDHTYYREDQTKKLIKYIYTYQEHYRQNGSELLNKQSTYTIYFLPNALLIAYYYIKHSSPTDTLTTIEGRLIYDSKRAKSYLPFVSEELLHLIISYAQQAQENFKSLASTELKD